MLSRLGTKGFTKIKGHFGSSSIAISYPFAICLVRSKKHPVKVELKDQLLRYQGLVYAFLSAVDEELEQNELTYLAYQLKKGDQNAKSFTYTDEYELAVSLKVKALIALVSQEMKFDFSRDLVFF